MDRRHLSTLTPMRLLWALSVMSIAAVCSAAFASAAGAADTHGFPRTFHVWSCSSPDKLARYDMVVGYSYCDVARMRSLNPEGIFLLQPGLDLGTSAYNAVQFAYGAQQLWKGGNDTISDGAAANLGFMRAFQPEWDYLRNADGSIATISPSYASQRGWNLADPTAKGTPELIAKLIAYAAKQRKLYRNGWDGIYGDVWTYGYIGESWYYGRKLDTDRNGVIDDLTVLRRNFDTNLARVGHLLRSYLPGKIVGGNGNHEGAQAYFGTEADGWLKSANFTQVEHIQKKYRNNPGALVSKARQWLDYPDPKGMTRYLATVQNGLKCDGSDLLVPFGSDPNQPQYMLNACVMKSMRWGLTLVLLTDGYYEVYPYNTHAARWWYDEYDGGEGIRKRGYLGKALGDPQQLANGVWRRNFTNGIALNNSTSLTQTVSLETAYRRIKGTQNPTLNNGAQVTSVSIPEHDGIILLRTSPTGGGSTSFQVTSKSSLNGQTVSGAVNWEATATGANVSKIEFSIDGKIRWTETISPYQFNGNNGVWDTTKETNGSHTLSLRGVATDGKVATSSITVTVSNGTGFQVLSQTPTNGATVRGAVRWEAVASGAPVEKIEFMVDGALRSTEGTSPYLFNKNGTWDTTKETNGSHTLALRATATDGRVTTSTITVTVSN